MQMIDYDKIRDTISSQSPFHLTNHQIDQVLEFAPNVKLELEKWGITDTVSREMFFSAFAKMLVGRDWPINMEVAKDPTFFIELVNAARAAGIVIEDNR
jgi:hypothetical protein